MIERQDDLTFSGDTDCATEGVALLVREQATVLVTEIDVPGKSACVAAIREVRETVARSAVVVFTRFVDPALYNQLVAVGTSGFLTKFHTLDDLVDVIRKAARGERPLHPPHPDSSGDDRWNRASPSGAVRLLSVREVEVARLLALGLSVKEVATALQRSPKTVDAHKSHILSKLQVSDRVGLTRWAIREGLVEP
jgi:DNA-binding NarL/FixJ family response regulator